MQRGLSAIAELRVTEVFTIGYYSKYLL